MENGDEELNECGCSPRLLRTVFALEPQLLEGQATRGG